jgi:hypothetical protein
MDEYRDVFTVQVFFDMANIVNVGHCMGPGTC